MPSQKKQIITMISSLFLMLTSNSFDAEAQSATPKEVKVAVFDNYPPAEWRDQDGQLKGYAVDLVEAVAKKAGWKIELIPSSFDVIFPGIQSKKFDLGVSSLAVNRERLQIMDMIPISMGGNVVGMLKASGLVADKAIDLCGRSVGIIRGSIEGPYLDALSADHCVPQNLQPVEVLTFPDPGAVLAALESRRIDFMSNGLEQMKDLIKKRPDLAMGVMYSKTWTSWAVRKGDELGPELVEAVNSLIKDGTYGAIFAKWDALPLKQTLVINANSPNEALIPGSDQ